MKILMLYTGGTISCALHNGVLSPRADIRPTVEKMFKNCKDVKLSHKTLPPVLSENTDGKVLTKIMSAVKKAVFSLRYDGVIVTVGSDALAYTSAAISYTLGLCKTPCVVVCSDLPLSDPEASGNANLKAAVSLIRSKKCCGALTVYPDKSGAVSVYRASRVLQQPLYLSNPVAAGELYGAVRDGEFYPDPSYCEVEDSFAIQKPRLSTLSPVMLISVYPGMIYPSLPRRTKAVILDPYHSGTVNTASPETLKFARHCKKRGVRVYVGGSGSPSDYESMQLYGELGFIRLPRLSSTNAMFIKLWLLSSSIGKFANERLFSPLGGDLTKSISDSAPSSPDNSKKDTETGSGDTASAKKERT